MMGKIFISHVYCRQIDKLTVRQKDTQTRTILQVDDKWMSDIYEDVSLHLGPNTITDYKKMIKLSQ